VGEVVNLSLTPAPSCGSVTWTLSGVGTLSGTTYTAPDRAGSATITADAGCGCGKWTKTFSVIEPSGAVATTNGAAAPDTFAAGAQGVCMHLIFTFQPTTVCFSAVQFLEVPGPASNITGYMTRFNPASLAHSPSTTWIGLDESNRPLGQDHAHHAGYPSPWSAGGFDWVIPVAWRVGSGNAKTNLSWTQSVRITDTSGTTSVTKAGASATRTP